MNRRHLISGAPVAALAAALSAGGVAQAIATQVADHDTPIAAMFREWSALYDFINSDEARGMEDIEWTPHHDRMWRIADDIIDMPAQSGTDFIAKVVMFTCFGEHGLPDHSQAPQLWEEAKALTV